MSKPSIAPIRFILHYYHMSDRGVDVRNDSIYILPPTYNVVRCASKTMHNLPQCLATRSIYTIYMYYL